MPLLDEDLDQQYLDSLGRNNPRLGYGPLVGMPQGGRVHFPGNVPSFPASEWDGGRGLLRSMVNDLTGTDVPEGAQLVRTDAGLAYLLPDGRYMLTGPRHGEDVREYAPAPPRRGSLLPVSTDQDTGEVDLAMPRVVGALPALGVQGGGPGTLGAGARRMRARPNHVTIDPDNLPPLPPAPAGHNRVSGDPSFPGRPAPTMTQEEALAVARSPRPGAGVPLLEGDDLLRAGVLSGQVTDFRQQQMALPLEERVQPRPEDQLFRPAEAGKPLPDVPQGAQAHDLNSLRVQNIAPGAPLPKSRAKAGSMQDVANNYGPVYDSIAEELMPVARLMRGEQVPNATEHQRTAAGSGAFYNMRPIYDQMIASGWTHDDAMRRIRQEAQAIAGTSPRTDTTQNVINSSFLQNRMARGLPMDPASIAAVAGEGTGYSMIYGTHPELTEGLLTGTATLGRNPKPDTFGSNIAGDLSATTADVHNVRAILMRYNDVHPGSLPVSAFTSEAKYREYLQAYAPTGRGANRRPGVGLDDEKLREMLVARPSGQAVRGEQVSTEYPLYHDITARIGERLGLAPADAQALMWFYYGGRTGLESTASTIPQLLNQRMSITSQGIGMPIAEVAENYWRNRIPLAGVAGAAALGGRGLLGDGTQ